MTRHYCSRKDCQIDIAGAFDVREYDPEAEPLRAGNVIYLDNNLVGVFYLKAVEFICPTDRRGWSILALPLHKD